MSSGVEVEMEVEEVEVMSHGSGVIGNKLEK